MNLLRRGVDGQQFRQVFWACANYDRKTQGEKLRIYSLGDGKPVQWAKKRGNMAMLWRFEDNTCSVIQKFLRLTNRYFGIPARRDYSNRFLREQRHRSGFWLRQQKDIGKWY